MAVALEKAAERCSGVWRNNRRVGVALAALAALASLCLSSCSRARELGVVSTTSVSLVLELPVVSLAGLAILSLSGS